MSNFRHVRESHEPRLAAANFLVGAVQPLDGYFAFDATSGITNWGMDGNDYHGDCGFAMLDHANVAEMGDSTQAGKLFFPEYTGVLPAYYAYGLSIGEVGPPNAPNQPDFGVANAQMLPWAYTNGFIDDYMEVPISQLDWWASQCMGVSKGVCVGIAMNNHVANEGPGVPWGSSPEDLINLTEGHDVYYGFSVGDGTGELITWGFRKRFTVEFRQNFTDAWVVGTRNLDFVDSEALAAVLTQMNGVVRPRTS